jgi:REP element-mobilizing transposase RayT
MVKLFNERFRIESARNSNWDYSSPGRYFVTICTDADIHWFGKIEKYKMHLSKLGEIADKYWQEIPLHHKNVELDNYIIMPNHIHSIIVLKGKRKRDERQSHVCSSRDVACNVSTNDNNRCMSKISPKSESLSTIIRSYKSSVTKSAHLSGYKHFKWQPRFYDHIVRDKRELYTIRRYIANNPEKWGKQHDRVIR